LFKEACEINSPNSDIAVIKKLDKVIEIDPSYAPAYLKRAQANLYASHYEDAASDASLALLKDETLIEAYGIRGTAYIFLCDIDDIRNGLWDIKVYFEKGGEDPNIYFPSFLGWLALNNEEKAIQDLKKGANANIVMCKSILSQFQSGLPLSTFKCKGK
jgi:hypothetical protein